jgi:cell division transport system permease protein
MFGFFIVFSILILSKQISIWFFEHQKRITIIQYHGGSIWYSSAPIMKIALISSILASIIAILLSYYVKNNLTMLFSQEILAVISDVSLLSVDMFKISLVSVIISIIPIIGVLLKYKLKHKA